MKQIIIKIVISLILTLLFSSIESLNIKDNGIDILFTVTTVVFSVGMSLVVSSSTQNIHNTEVKRAINRTKKNICTNCVAHFITLCILYTLFGGLKLDPKYSFDIFRLTLNIKPSVFMLLMTVFCNLYLINMFNGILDLNNDIEEQVDKELNQ